MSRLASSSGTRVALLINRGHPRRMPGGEHQSWMRGLVATQARRATVVTLGLSLNIVIQLMNLLDVFAGAPPWVLIAIFMIQILALGVAIVVLVLNLRERRARPHR